MAEVSPKNASSDIAQNRSGSIPQYQRDLFPTNIALSAADLCELSKIIQKANDEALVIELASIGKDADNKEDREKRIRELLCVEYILRASSGDSIQGLGVPTVEDFPDRLANIYISTSSFSQKSVNSKALNYLDAFLSFDTPKLKMDFSNLPSNRTENKSVINIVGRNENWVRATAEKLEEFFNRKKTLRPVIHGSGIYDLFLYAFYLPIFLGFLVRYDENILPWLAHKSILLNVIFSIYVFFLSLIFARLLFQIVRWLFPPIEYFKTSRTPATIARVFLGAALASIFFAALYDFLKFTFLKILNSAQ